MIRLFRRLLLAAMVAAASATPILAQQYSDSFTFLKAVRDRDGAKVEELLADASSNAVNARETSTGEGALHIVVRRRDIDWLAYLLGHGARADFQANDGTTPLGLAAQIGWIEGAQQLLARGAHVDLANNRGETPLILAVQAREPAMVRFLVAHGADPNRTDSFAGYSALDYARRDDRNPQLLRALEDTQPERRQVFGPTPD